MLCFYGEKANEIKVIHYKFIEFKLIQSVNTRVYFNTNYRTEMKLMFMDYHLLQFDALS